MTFAPTVKIIPYADEAPLFAHPPVGWALHVQAGNHDPYSYWANLKAPNRAFAHFWVRKDGAAVRYQDLHREAWAQAAGNHTYWSVETEGYPAETLTPAQIITCARIHIALHAKDAIANTPGSPGIGVHSMGGAAWGGHPLCPGSHRANQRMEIIAAAQTLRDGVPSHPYPGATRRGSLGSVVRQIQTRLTQIGYPLLVDGVFGQHTEDAVKRFQHAHGLVVDGIVGPLTWRRLWL